MRNGLGGYQPDTDSSSSRRADFDLRRRLARLERDVAAGGGGGGGGTYIGGAGLTLTGGDTFNVGAGTGIAVSADSVAADLTFLDARYAPAKRYAVDVGGATSQVITHNLNTLDVIVQVYRKASPYDQIECDVEHTSINTATLRFATAPTAAKYRAVVLA